MFSLRIEAISFSRWFVENEQWIREQYATDIGSITKQVNACDDCDGSGKTPCDRCGSSEECDNCEGSGKILLEVEEVIREYGRKRYDEQTASDKKKFDAFVKEQEQEHAI